MTGEPEDIKKTRDDDCFLLSSCLVTTIDGGSNCKAVVIGIGTFSQWGKIKANLVTESVNTPLQDKLETMTKQVKLFLVVIYFIIFIIIIIITIISDWISWIWSCHWNFYRIDYKYLDKRWGT